MKYLLGLLLVFPFLLPAQTAADATAAFDRSDWARAAAAYDKLLKTNPRSTEYAMRLGVSLANLGRCPEALAQLKKAGTSAVSEDLKKAVGQSGIRCAMALNQQDDALTFLRGLRRQFPKDPEIQYLSVHVLSDLSIRASQELLFDNPSAYQVHQLNAESLETQGKWDEAMAEYRAVLEKNPDVPGVHFRIGRLILSKPKTLSTFSDAKKEFEAELKIDPNNSGAEYVLGEIARQQQKWNDAIAHFTRATELDHGFADAFVGLGTSLLGSGKDAEAIAPLEMAARLQPQNPASHYQLAIAYRRAGRMNEANQEFKVYKEASAQADNMRRSVQEGVTGTQQPSHQ
jgi:tetratricopeptide (TPR) repeat protein